MKNRMFASSYSTFDATSLDADYLLCEPGLPQATSILRFVNTSGVNILISYDGITGHDVIPSYSTVELSLQQNMQPGSSRCAFYKGMPIYVAYELGAGKGGDLYIISYYQVP